MKTSLSLLFSLLFFSLPIFSQSKLDLSLLRTLDAAHRHAPAREVQQAPDTLVTVLAILQPNATLCEADLEPLRATPGTSVGRVLTLTLPLSQLEALAGLSQVQSLHANRSYQTACLNARVETGCAMLHDEQLAQGEGFSQPYTGRGVLLGIVDTGVDYSNINFRDPITGQTRLKGAVLYRPTEGDAAEVRECYTDPMQIDTLTSDCTTTGHGTLTAGCAAGSYQPLGLQGMAPETDLMLCGTSSLYDDRLIDGLVNTFARAEELSQPCVVSLSIGNPIGWKDGLDPLGLVCEALTDHGNAPGRVILFSSGNDGEKRFTLDHQFTDTLPVYTLLEPHVTTSMRAYYNPNVDVYCSDSLPVRLDLALYDTLAHAWLDLPFEQHLLDTLELAHDSRRHLCVDADTCYMDSYPHCLMAARLQGQPGSSVTCYYVNRSTVNYAMRDGGLGPRWLSGSPQRSISDLCVSDAVISVGAYSAADSLYNVFGRICYPWAPRGEVCSYSSYGYSAQGVPKPDVLCPGSLIVTSLSRFSYAQIEYYYTSHRYLTSPMVSVVDEEGGPYYWMHANGTSLSSPILAGIIALWLEADPTLTLNDVRSILQQTSRFDDYCLHAPGGVIQSGAGKADAIAGLHAVLQRSSFDHVLEDVPVRRATHRRYDLFGRVLSSGSKYSGFCFEAE